MSGGGAAITAWAWRTPLGDDVDAVLARLLGGERAAAPIAGARLDADTFPCRIACTIDAEPPPSRYDRFLRRMGRFALLAAREAAARGRLGEAGAASGDRLGLYFGYGGLRAHWNDMMPALARQEDAGSAGSWQRGLRLLHPFWMLQHLSNNAHALAAQELGARGDGLTVAGANAGAQALEAAVAALQAGAVDAALVVAYDTLVEPETLVELAARGGFTGGGVPAAPYDRAAAGFVPGEAAAAVLLERPADAGARALALVDAWSGADGAPTEPAGATLARLLALLPGDAGLSIGVVDGAARATPARDAEERAALATRPDLVSPETPICATLGAMGQLGAAAAVVQAITLGASLRAGRLAPVAALESPAPGPLCPLRPHAAPEAAVRPAHPVGLGLSTGAPGLVGLVRVALP